MGQIRWIFFFKCLRRRQYMGDVLNDAQGFGLGFGIGAGFGDLGIW